jgi:hypothetical protein
MATASDFPISVRLGAGLGQRSYISMVAARCRHTMATAQARAEKTKATLTLATGSPMIELVVGGKQGRMKLYQCPGGGKLLGEGR